MVAACQQLHLQQLVALALPNDAILQLCLLRVRHLVVVSIRLVLLLIADEPVSEEPLPLPSLNREGLGVGLHYRPIRLMHLTLGKHTVQAGEGF